MKIAIPVDQNNPETTVCVSFGRSPYFLIYDTETKETSFIGNEAAASQGGAGIKAAQTIADNNVKALLTLRCGENAAAVLHAANIKLYKTSGTSAAENISKFIDGKLDVLEEIHPGFHNHGGK